MINRQLRDACAGSFRLHLNAEQIRQLILIDREKREFSWTTAQTLERRGLVRWEIEKADTWPKLTTAGQLVVALLREAGLYPALSVPRKLREVTT